MSWKAQHCTSSSPCKTLVIHVSSLIPCRTWHLPQAQVLSHPSHLLLLSFRRSHLHTQDLWSSTHIYPAMFHGSVADQHKSHLSQVVSPNRLRSKPSRPKRSSLKTSSRRIELGSNLRTDPYQIQERFMTNNYQNPITEDVDEFGKVGESQMHSDCDSAESIADSDHKDCMGNTMQWSCRRERGKCTIDSSPKGKFEVSLIWRSESFGETRCIVFIWAGKPSPLNRQNREDCKSSRISTAQGNLLQWYQREEQVQCVLKLNTREEKAWRQVHLTNREQRRNLLQCFRQEFRNREINSRVLFSKKKKTLIRLILEDLLLKAIKIICTIKQDLNSWDKNIKLDLSMIVLMSYSSKQMLSYCNCKTPITDLWNLEESKYDYKKNYLWRKRFSDILKFEIFMKWETWRELKHHESTNSLYNNWEKVMTRYRDSLHKYKSCKRGRIAWTVPENFKK